jgi:hypothetical protein
MKKIIFITILIISLLILNQSIAEATSEKPLFAVYYPWYGIPSISGYWFHWNEANHNPDNILNGRRDVAAKDYPLLDVYDSNVEILIKKHIDFAKKANINGFVISWWGNNVDLPNSAFTGNALARIKNVFEQNNFNFTIYYETTGSVDTTINDIKWILDNHAKSSSWYKIDNRPVIFVYARARSQLDPTLNWDIDGYESRWSPYEDVRASSRNGIFIIPPVKDSIGYVESKNPIYLYPGEIYKLNVSISDVRDDCSPNSDVGFRIMIKDLNGTWIVLDDRIVNFNKGWLDLSYDISRYAGKNVMIRVESYDGGKTKWCSEFAAVDYFYITNSKNEIINKDQAPYFDNEWKIVTDKLHQMGYNPYFIMDFEGYEDRVQYFAEYFLNFVDGIHTYFPSRFSIEDISNIYLKASSAAKSKNKVFLATVIPGYDDTTIRSPGFIIDRNNGFYYNSIWSAAKSSNPNGYLITSFNEWHEATEIEPSLEYQDFYINLTSLNTCNNDGTCFTDNLCHAECNASGYCAGSRPGEANTCCAGCFYTDITGDGKVNAKDVALVSSAYGSKQGPPPSPNWNPLADINKDGKVDVKDVVMITKKYGVRCEST